MKKILFLLTMILLIALDGFSQAPGILNYQGVARNSVGNVLANKNISLRLTIRNNTAAGPTVYQETRGVTTNPFGLFNVQVGSPGASGVTGTIAGVPWGVGLKFIQVEIDPNGGSSFINIGTAQLASVPYALYANLAGDLVLPFNKTQADAGTLFKITNSGTGSGSTALEGLTNSTAGSANAIIGTVTSAAPGGFSSGVRGINNGTGVSGIGVYGSQAGGGWGVYGTAVSGVGVYGQSTSGTGVYGQSNTGVAGIFINTNAANASDALQATSNGTGWAANITSTNATTRALRTAGGLRFTGIGEGAPVLPNTFKILGGDAAGNATWQHASAIGLVSGSGTLNFVPKWTPNGTTLGNSLIFDNGTNVGVGTTTPSVRFEVMGSQPGAPTQVLRNLDATGYSSTTLYSAGGGIMGHFGYANPGAGFWANQMFAGSIAPIPFVFTVSDIERMRINPNGNVGIGQIAPTARFQVDNAGTNVTGLFNKTNAANTAFTVSVSDADVTTTGFNNGGIYSVKGLTGTTNVLVGQTAIKGVSGLPTGIGVNGGSDGGYGVAGVTNTGTGVLGIAVDPTAYGLRTVGRVRISGQGAAANRVLTSDATGNATWQALGGGVGIGGAGTLNYVSKWTPDGSNLGNSQIFDNGTRVGINTGASPLIGQLDLLSNTQQMMAHRFTGTTGFDMFYNNTSDYNGYIGTWNTATSNRNFDVGTGDINNVGSLNLTTQALPRMSIVPNGFVGVNTLAPAARMEIMDNSNVVTPQLLINEDDNDFARINFKTTNAVNAGNNFWAVAGYNHDTRGNERLNFWNNATGNLMSISGAGHIGMDNTSFSSAKLTVFSNDGPNRGFPAVRIQNTFSGQGVIDGIYMGYNVTTTGDAFNLNQEIGDYTIGTNNNFQQLILKNAGEVGIGTTNPVGKLHVEGAGTSTSVTPSWINYAPNSYFRNTAPSANNKVGGLGYAEGSTGAFNEGLLGIAGGSATNANIGVVGLAGEVSAASNMGLFAQVKNSAAGNFGVYSITPNGANDRAGYFQGKVQIVDGTQAAGRVFTSDASGTGSWQENTAQSVGISARQFTASNIISTTTITPLTNWGIVLNEDGGANYNAGTGEYTITKTGTYQINGSVLWNTTPNGGSGVYSALRILLNGAFEYETFVPVTQNAFISNVVAFSKRLNAGDVVSFEVYQNSGANMTLNNIFFGQHFSIQFVHK